MGCAQVSHRWCQLWRPRHRRVGPSTPNHIHQRLLLRGSYKSDLLQVRLLFLILLLLLFNAQRLGLGVKQMSHLFNMSEKTFFSL